MFGIYLRNSQPDAGQLNIFHEYTFEARIHAGPFAVVPAGGYAQFAGCRNLSKLIFLHEESAIRCQPVISNSSEKIHYTKYEALNWHVRDSFVSSCQCLSVKCFFILLTVNQKQILPF